MAWVLPAIQAGTAIYGAIEGAKTNAQAAEYQQAQTEIAQQQAQFSKLATLYGPQLAMQLMGMIKNTYTNPAITAARIGFENNANAFGRTVLPDYMMQLEQAGGGRLGSSSVADNAALALRKAQLGQVVSGEVGLIPQMEQFRLGAMGQLGGFVGQALGAGANASNTFGDMAASGFGRGAQYGPALAGLMNSIGLEVGKLLTKKTPGTPEFTGAGSLNPDTSTWAGGVPWAPDPGATPVPQQPWNPRSLVPQFPSGGFQGPTPSPQPIFQTPGFMPQQPPPLGYSDDPGFLPPALRLGYSGYGKAY